MRVLRWLRATLPLASLAIFAVTLWRCFHVMRSAGHWDKWHLGPDELPMISMLGIDEPEHTAFAHGFTALAVVVAATFIVRDRQLERALRGHAAARRVAMIVGMTGLGALLLMAWIPGDQDAHFIAALATFVLLSAYAAIHTALCGALRMHVALRVFMAVCPAASLAFVVLWIIHGSARAQYAAVAAQFAYFLALLPSFLAPDPATPAEGDAKYGPSLVAMFAALWMAALVVPPRIAEMNAPVCEDGVWCFDAQCNAEHASGYAPEREGGTTLWCPKPKTVERLRVGPSWLAPASMRVVWFVGTLACALAFLERPRSDQSARRRTLARAALLFVVLAIGYAAWKLTRRPEIAPFVLAGLGLFVVWLEGDRMFRGRTIRGFASPITFAYGAVAASVAVSLARFHVSDKMSVLDWQRMSFEQHERFAGAVAHDALAPLQVGLLLGAPILALAGILGVARETEMKHAHRLVALGALGIAGIAHLVGRFTLLDAPRFVAVVPLAAFVFAMARGRRLGRTTCVALVSAIVFADFAAVLTHALAWLDFVTSEEHVFFAELARGQHAALRWDWARMLVDAIATGIVLREARPQRDGDDRAFAAMAGAAAVTAIGVLLLWRAQDAFGAAVSRTLEVFRVPEMELPITNAHRDAPIVPTYFVGANGDVRYASPDIEPTLGPRQPPPPVGWALAADRRVTIDALERAIGSNQELTLLLSSSLADETSTPELGALGFRRGPSPPPRIASIEMAWLSPSVDRWSGPHHRYGRLLTIRDGKLTDFERAEESIALPALCAQHRSARVLVVEVDGTDTIGDVVARAAPFEDEACAFTRIAVTRRSHQR